MVVIDCAQLRFIIVHQTNRSVLRVCVNVWTNNTRSLTATAKILNVHYGYTTYNKTDDTKRSPTIRHHYYNVKMSNVVCLRGGLVFCKIQLWRCTDDMSSVKISF